MAKRARLVTIEYILEDLDVDDLQDLNDPIIDERGERDWQRIT